jgi:hypothetical protein
MALGLIVEDAVLGELLAQSLCEAGHVPQVLDDVTVVVLLACGSRPSEHPGIPFHLSIEKPARLPAVLIAVDAARTR